MYQPDLNRDHASSPAQAGPDSLLSGAGGNGCLNCKHIGAVRHAQIFNTIEWSDAHQMYGTIERSNARQTYGKSERVEPLSLTEKPNHGKCVSIISCQLSLQFYWMLCLKAIVAR